jgi:hypothetical protein
MGPLVQLIGGVAAVGVIAVVLFNRSGGMLFHSTAQNTFYYEQILMQKMLMDEFFTKEFLEQNVEFSPWTEDRPQEFGYVWLFESNPIKGVVDIKDSESWDIPFY